MTVQAMDICLNVTAEPTFPSRREKNTRKNTASVENSIKRIKKSVLEKSTENDTQIGTALNSSKVNLQKRVKQKSLAAIFAKKFSDNVRPQQKTPNQEKHQSKDSSSKLPLSNLSDKCLSDKQTTIQSNNIASNQHESSENNSIVSFSKTKQGNIGRTIVAKKRNINDISEKKSLADIFSKNTKVKAKESSLLSFSKKSVADDSCTISKKPKLNETLKSKNKLTFKESKPNDPKHLKGKGKFPKKLNEEQSDGQSPKVFHRHTGKISSLFGNNPEVPNIGQRLIKPVNETVFSGTDFSDLDIHPFTVANLKQNMNITKMTTVQQKAIPQIFLRKDILIRSQTGSGKTMAYALPIVELLHKIRPKLMRSDGTKALVIVPTRELALQTYECFLKLVKPFTWIVPGYLVGGEKRKAEKARLRKGCTILIATPGRLLDHIKHTEALRLNDIKYFVLDEADRMLDMGYERDISEIVNALTTSNSSDNKSEYNPMQLLRKNNKKVFSEEATENEEKLVHEDNEVLGEGNNKKRKQYHSDDESDLEDDTVPVNNKKVTGNKLIDTETAQNSVIQQGKSELDSFDSSRRQTILLSATLTQAVEKLAGLTMENPVFVDAAKENLETVGGDMSELNEDLVVPQSVVQTYIVVPPKLRMVTLSAYIAGKCQRSGQHKILIFMATQDMVDYHAEILSSVLNKPIDEEDEDSDPLVDVDFFQLHGNMTQKERTDVFKTFRQAKTGVLLCTDVAARGLDLPKVDSVIQYTGPISARDYVHRIGRTARAGSSGYATIFLTPAEVEFVRILESRRVRIKQENTDDVLDHLLGPLSKHNTPHSAAIALQNDFESLILESKKLREKAYKAYTSWLRFYSSYPREMRQVFDRKELHLGHYAKSFGLRDPPQRIGGFARKLIDRDSKPRHENSLHVERTDSAHQQQQQQQQQRRQRSKKGQDGGERVGSLKKCRMLNTSEYASGLEPIKKPKRS